MLKFDWPAEKSIWMPCQQPCDLPTFDVFQKALVGRSNFAAVGAYVVVLVDFCDYPSELVGESPTCLFLPRNTQAFAVTVLADPQVDAAGCCTHMVIMP